MLSFVYDIDCSQKSRNFVNNTLTFTHAYARKSSAERLFGGAVETRIRSGIHHVDKVDFLEMLHKIRLETYTIQNIRGGFSYAGIVPFDPEKVLSKLQLAVGKTAPAPSPPSTSSSATRSPKTPYNSRTLERQAQSIKKLLNWSNSSEDTPSNQAFNQLIKGSLLQMHNAALLARENDQLREAVNDLQKWRSRRIQALPNTGILTVAEGRELATAPYEAINPPQAANENKASQAPQRAPPRCSNC